MQINRLRIINFYEADHNLILKCFWPNKATHLTEESKTLGENTWDARPNCSTEHDTLLDEIITEIHRLTYLSLCKFQDDTVACYDRIVPTHAMIYSRKLKVPSSVYQLAAHTLKDTKYHVQTANIISNNYYISTTEEELYGLGQGSGFAGTTWLFIEDPMTTTIEKECEDCNMSIPDKSISWTKFITRFINVNRQYLNDWINNDTSNILNKIKLSVQAWEYLLHTSGGSLELSKYALYLISWNFNDDGTSYINSTTNISLHIISSSTERKKQK